MKTAALLAAALLMTLLALPAPNAEATSTKHLPFGIKETATPKT